MSLHQRLADARIHLRNAKDDHEKARAFAEHRAIERGVSGKNAEERERNLTIALAADEDYQRVLKSLRGAEAVLDKTESDLETERDQRRANEWQIRAKLADGLFRSGIQSDNDDPAGDSAFDDSLDGVTLSRLESNLRNGYHNVPAPIEEETELPF